MNHPLTFLAIVKVADRRDVLFGILVQDPLLGDGENSWVQITKEYVEGYLYDMHLSPPQLKTTDPSFKGRIHKVSKSPASFVEEFELHIVQINEQGPLPERRDHILQQDAAWWRTMWYGEGGWKDRLDYDHTGQDPRPPKPTEQTLAKQNFWNSFWSTFGLVLLAIITLGTIKTMYDSFTDD